MNNRCLRIVTAFVLITVIMCNVFPVSAETIDLAAMTDDQIISLLDKINNEVVKRGIRKTATLPKGTYIAGKDIPCGSYIYTCLATGDDWGNLTVYSEEGKGKQLLWEVLLAPDEGKSPETIFIKLNQGDQLKSGVPFSLTISGGILFR